MFKGTLTLIFDGAAVSLLTVFWSCNNSRTQTAATPIVIIIMCVFETVRVSCFCFVFLGRAIPALHPRASTAFYLSLLSELEMELPDDVHICPADAVARVIIDGAMMFDEPPSTLIGFAPQQFP